MGVWREGQPAFKRALVLCRRATGNSARPIGSSRVDWAAQMDRPVLFCYDGSEGAKSALAVAAELGARPADAVVLTVWMPATILLARGGSLATAYVPNEGVSTNKKAPPPSGCRGGRRGGPPAGLRRLCADCGSDRVDRQDGRRGGRRDRCRRDRLRSARPWAGPQRAPRQRLARALSTRAAAGSDRAHPGAIGQPPGRPAPTGVGSVAGARSAGSR
jgi:hypothetical protein